MEGEKAFTIEETLKMGVFDLILTNSSKVPYITKINEKSKSEFLNKLYFVLEEIRKTNVEFDKVKLQFINKVDYKNNLVEALTKKQMTIALSLKRKYILYFKKMLEIQKVLLQTFDSSIFSSLFGMPKEESKPIIINDYEKQEVLDTAKKIEEDYFFEIKKGGSCLEVLKDIVFAIKEGKRV